MNNWARRLLWLIYLALLGVLLPHTAWAFGQFEPARWHWLGWIAALAFEGAIASLTWRLKQVIESTPKYRSSWVRFRKRYTNVYSVGLLLATGVSSVANWTHAVEFGQPFTVFVSYSVPPILYSVAFGGILPVCSLLFAHILADTNEAEQEANEDLERANATIRNLRREIREAEHRAQRAEQRFAAMGDLVAQLFAEEKQSRILAARQMWPELPGRSIAIIADTSPSYVSEILSGEVIEHQ